MTKIDSLRRLLLPCFSPSSSSTKATSSPVSHPPKKRLSTSLRDDLPEPDDHCHPQDGDDDQDADDRLSPVATGPPRPSKTMVVGTIFGSRRGGGHVFFCVQHDRLATKRPLLLLELSVPTGHLVREMRFGLVRVALESDRPEFKPLLLRSVPVWNMTINGRRAGFARRRRPTEADRLLLESIKSMTVGAGVIPSGGEEEEEVMYMRANYEHVVGGADLESFHLINPELGSGAGQEFSVFLVRSSG